LIDYDFLRLLPYSTADMGISDWENTIVRAVFSRERACIYSEWRFLVSPGMFPRNEFFLEMLRGYNFLCDTSSI
jgi:hypothetical protein